MMLQCPTCNHRHGLDAFAAEARDVLVLIASVPHGLAAIVLRYLGMFAPASQALRWSRAADLLMELVGVMEKGVLEFNRATHTIPPDAWRPALEDMLDRRVQLGKLDSHGYLWQVLITKARNLDAESEREREANRKRGVNRDYQPSSKERHPAQPSYFPGPQGNSPPVEETDEMKRQAKEDYEKMMRELTDHVRAS